MAARRRRRRARMREAAREATWAKFNLLPPRAEPSREAALGQLSFGLSGGFFDLARSSRASRATRGLLECLRRASGGALRQGEASELSPLGAAI